jgi:hypothetical protein
VKIYVAAVGGAQEKGNTGWNLVYYQSWWFSEEPICKWSVVSRQNQKVFLPIDIPTFGVFLYNFCPTICWIYAIVGWVVIFIACVCARGLHLMDGWVKDEKKLCDKGHMMVGWVKKDGKKLW